MCTIRCDIPSCMISISFIVIVFCVVWRADRRRNCSIQLHQQPVWDWKYLSEYAFLNSNHNSCLSVCLSVVQQQASFRNPWEWVLHQKMSSLYVLFCFDFFKRPVVNRRLGRILSPPSTAALSTEVLSDIFGTYQFYYKHRKVFHSNQIPQSSIKSRLGIMLHQTKTLRHFSKHSVMYSCRFIFMWLETPFRVCHTNWKRERYLGAIYCSICIVSSITIPSEIDQVQWNYESLCRVDG